MTRIFDALRKAEAARPGGTPQQASVTPIGQPHGAAGARGVPAPPSRGPELRVALPLVGGIELTPDTVREMTSLRVSIESSLGDRTPRVVMFVSPQGGEGTSTVALQFAQVLARDTAVRPLLIDAHVRRPVFDIDPTHRAALLEPRLQLGLQAPASGPSVNLFVVPTNEELRRTGVFQPAEMRQVLDATTAGFDWVVIDGPPVLESPDAAPLSGVADAVILVLQAGRTKRPVLVRSADLLRKAGANVLGSILNRRVLEIPEFIYRRI